MKHCHFPCWWYQSRGCWRYLVPLEGHSVISALVFTPLCLSLPAIANILSIVWGTVILSFLMPWLWGTVFVIDHDDVIIWKHFPCYWPFVRLIYWWLVNTPHKGQWRRTLMVSLIYALTNGWENHWDTGDLRRHPTHYDIAVMVIFTNMMTSWHGNNWHITDPLWGESTSNQQIALRKGQLC